MYICFRHRGLLQTVEYW